MQAGKLTAVNYRDKRPKKTRKLPEETAKVRANTGLHPADEPPILVFDDPNTEAFLPETQAMVEDSDNFCKEDYHETDGECHPDQSEEEVVKAHKNYGKMFVECKEQLFMRKDNYMYFITAIGTPCDRGAQQLLERNKLPRFSDLNPGEIKILNKSNKLRLFIIVRGEMPASTTEVMENLAAAFKVLKQIIIKEKLNSISLAKSKEIENVQWDDMIVKLRNILKGVPIKIIICQGIIKYVNEQDRTKVIEELHDSAVGGHRGVNKTFKRIKQKYYWENIKDDVQNYIRKCLKCQLKKLVRVKTKQPMTITDTPHSPMEKVSLDIVGPFPVSKNGHNNILTIQCNFSKYCLAIPLRDATAESVADAFIKRFICIFGAPLMILTDQGSNFMSSCLKQIARKFKIKQIKTTAYHPQSNGSLERSHHSLAEYIKMLIDKETAWDECLELATLCYNTVPHEAHLFTPFELVFGKLARLPSSEPVEQEEQLPTYNHL